MTDPVHIREILKSPSFARADDSLRRLASSSSLKIARRTATLLQQANYECRESFSGVIDELVWSIEELNDWRGVIEWLDGE